MPHSEKSLFQLRSFHLALWTPIIIAGLMAIYIIITSNLTFKSGFSGLNNIWDIFKVPFTIFSLTFPSVALVTANHRSIQSKKQIKAAESQNNFANYYKHLQEFKILLEDQNISSLMNYRQLHIRLFPSVKEGDYRIPSRMREKLLSDALDVYNKLKEIEELSSNLLESDEKESIKKEKILKCIVEAYKPIKNLREHFQFNPNDQDNITDAGLVEYIDQINMYDYISAISKTATVLTDACKFNSEFKIPYVIVAISELEKNNDLIAGIPTNRALNFNLARISEDGERRRFTKSYKSIVNINTN